LGVFREEVTDAGCDQGEDKGGQNAIEGLVNMISSNLEVVSIYRCLRLLPSRGLIEY
jgi:hypothetical protein